MLEVGEDAFIPNTNQRFVWVDGDDYTFATKDDIETLWKAEKLLVIEKDENGIWMPTDNYAKYYEGEPRAVVSDSDVCYYHVV